MREMTHENINAFIGACFEPGSSCAVFQYCSKGGLQVKINPLPNMPGFSSFSTMFPDLSYMHKCTTT